MCRSYIEKYMNFIEICLVLKEKKAKQTEGGTSKSGGERGRRNKREQAR
jgi:hypothetical protein